MNVLNVKEGMASDDARPYKRAKLEPAEETPGHGVDDHPHVEVLPRARYYVSIRKKYDPTYDPY